MRGGPMIRGGASDVRGWKCVTELEGRRTARAVHHNPPPHFRRKKNHYWLDKLCGGASACDININTSRSIKVGVLGREKAAGWLTTNG